MPVIFWIADSTRVDTRFALLLNGLSQMQFKDALNYVKTNGLAMLRAPGSNLQAVAVSSKGGGPITEATDFTVTGYVRRKLTSSEMDSAGIMPIRKVFAHMVDCA